MNPCNAIIRKWGICEDESRSRCLGLWLELETQNSFVMFSVTGVYSKDWKKNQLAYGIKRVMEITGVDDLKNLQGRPLRAKFEKNGTLGDVIIGIGHFMKEDWLIPREEEMWCNKD